MESKSIHLWEIDLDSWGSALEQLRECLSVDEVEQVNRYKCNPCRWDFIVTRGLLRWLLGSYLDVLPHQVSFAYGRYGKPALDYRIGLRFNISHSGRRALIAIAESIEIGIDIELVRPFENMELIAKQYFCREEVEELMSLSHDDRVAGFYRCWTRKEAYIKCLGAGLQIPLNTFRVTLLPSESARFIHINGDSVDASLWQILNIAVTGNYVAALVYRGKKTTLEIRSMTALEDLFVSNKTPGKSLEKR